MTTTRIFISSESALKRAFAFLILLFLLGACSGAVLRERRSPEDWIRQLRASETALQRLAAARVLGEAVRQSPAPDPRIVNALDGALRDHDANVRLEAALALAWIRHESGMTVPVLVEAMRRHGILALHRAAAEALTFADRNGESALAALRTRAQASWPAAPVLDVTGANSRTQAQTEQLIAGLVARLNGPTTASLAALQELERLGPEAAPAVPAIAAATRTGDLNRRVRAVQCLGRLGTVAFPALREVIDACYDADPALRAAGVGAVLRLDPNTGSSVYYLYSLLGDGTAEVRRAAARALAGFGPVAKAALGEPVTPERLKAIYWPRTLAMRTIAPAIPHLLAALQDADPGVRAASAAALGCISPDADKVIPALLAACGDADPCVRAAAAWALGELPAATPAAAARLRELQRDQAPAPRAEALLALVRISRDDAPLLPLLEQAARDSSPQVCRALLLAMEEVGAGLMMDSKPLSDALLGLTRHTDPRLRAAAVETLGGADLRTDEAIERLTRALEDPAPGVAIAAARALGTMGPAAADAVPALERLAAHDTPVRNPSLRHGAILALGWIDRQGTATLDRVIAAVAEPGVWSEVPPVERPPANALGPWCEASGTTQSLPQPYEKDGLLPTRHSPLAAVLLLGWRGPSAVRAAPLLTGILRERRNPAPVQLLAGMALESIASRHACREWPAGAPALLPPIFKTVQAENAERQLQAVTALIWLGPKAAPALPELSRLVQNRQCTGELRVAAAAALGAIGDGAAGQIPALAALLGGESDPGVKAAVATVLGVMGPKARAAEPALAGALADLDPAVRQAAALALGKLGAAATAAVPAALAPLLGDPDQRVRLAAATALGAFGPAARGAKPTLQGLAAADPDLLVRHAAAESLKKI